MGDDRTNYTFFLPKYVLANGKYIKLSTDQIKDINFCILNEQELNIKEWGKHFKFDFSFNEIKNIMYTMSGATLEKKLKNYQSNPTLKKLHDKYKEEMQYIFFARLVEKYCNYSYYEPENKESTMDALSKEAQRQFTSSTNNFLKQRWGFQYLKLLRHLYKFDECISFYNNHLKNMNASKVVKNLALNHVAGALYNSGKRINGLQNFISLFTNAPELRNSTYYSLKFDNDQEWNTVFDNCKNTKEKISMYFVRAIEPASVGLYDIEAIYKLDANSNFLPSLITKEINKIESNILGLDINKSHIFEILNNTNQDKQITEYMASMESFLNTAINNSQVKNKDFYIVAKSYINILMGNLDKSNQILSELSEQGKRDYVNQIALNKGLAKMFAINKSNLENAENKFMSVFTNELTDISKKWISNLYDINENNKFLFTESIGDLRSNLNTDKIKFLLSMENGNMSQFMKQVIIPEYWRNFIHNAWGEEKKTYSQNYRKMVLMEMLGTSYLRDNNISKAKETFEKVAPKLIEIQYPDFFLSYNPFNIRTYDNRTYEDNTIKYSKLKLVKVLSKISEIIEKGEATYTDYLLLGSAEYNTSYYGICWDAKEYYKCGYEPNGSPDCSKAYNYLMKAYNIATDNEAKAKCLYMASKANQAKYYLHCEKSNISYIPYYGDKSFMELEKQKIEMGYRNEMKILNKEYKDTQYYKDKIQECGYFWNASSLF
jgi:hypothetical protein